MKNYEEIGFKCGLELHNRLNVKTKLFCKCKPSFSNEKPTNIILRKLRPVAGETGQVDVAAMHEYLKNKKFLYQTFPETVCLVECDEEPIHSLNQEALEVTIQVAKLLKAEIPDEIHVMRKIVIDGSSVSSFQRTAIVGLNGVLETSKGIVRITNICLEEESAGIVDKANDEVTYRLDRLCIPLIEIGTAPDIKTPEHAKEVAEKLGMIIRSTGKSQRGLGVTRQDLNVSIKGGARVEIKGVQELDMIPLIIENEIKRQQDLIARGIKPKEETRVAKEDGTTEYMRPLPGEFRMYPETDSLPIIITKDFISKIKTPETWEEKAKRFSKFLPKEMVDQILRSEYLDLFEKFSKNYDPVLVANTFISTIKDLKRKGFVFDLKEEEFEELFSNINKKISKEAIPTVLEIACKEKISIKDAIEKSGLKFLSEDELRKLIRKVFEKNPNLVKEKRVSALMGEIMKEVRGSVDGKIVFKVLNEELKNKN
ncbi:MAG: Glu-tRNA(Gln) amidotransferase subunit GatE [Candidatus Aenigmatarchaeota archaeon]